MPDTHTPLNNQAAAAHLGMPLGTWTSIRTRGGGPKPDGYLGASPWWWPETLDAWKPTGPGKGNRTRGAQRTPGSRRRKT